MTKASDPKMQGIFDYLDKLRESGVTNMFGAGSYLERDFNMTKREAREALIAWMDAFGE